MKFVKLLLKSLLFLSVCSTVHLLPHVHSSTTGNFIPCEEGWILFGQYCYKLYGAKKSDALDWQNASHHCSSLGGNLTSIHSKEEQDFLAANMLLKEGWMIWIGLHNIKVEGSYVWEDGSDYNFTYFSPGRPIRNGTLNKEYCVEMRFEGAFKEVGEWYDVDCSAKLPFICKKERDETLKSPNHQLCPADKGGGWKFRNSCYNFVSEKKSWESAEQFCQNNSKGHLVMISDVVVDRFLSYQLSNLHEPIWIGIKLYNQLQQKWTSGWNVAYNFLPDVFSIDFQEGRCISWHQKPKDWTNTPCQRTHPFICETSKHRPPILKNPLKSWKCPERSKQWRDLGGEFCYYFDTKNHKNWHEAHFECHKRGGSLASIHSQEENVVLQPFIANSQHRLFIGLYLNERDEYSWSDGTSLQFTHWAVDKPSKSQEKCVEIWTANMTWKDVPCNERQGFICSVRRVPPNTWEKGGCPSVSFKSLVGPIVLTLLLVVLIVAVIYFTRRDLSSILLEEKRKKVTHHLTGTRDDKTHLLTERSLKSLDNSCGTICN